MNSKGGNSMNFIKSIISKLFHRNKQEDIDWKICPKCGEYMEPAYVYLDGNITEIEGWQCTGCGSYLINTNK